MADQRINIAGFINLVKIGEGGNSEVYSGIRNSDRKDVVIKVKLNKDGDQNFSKKLRNSIYGLKEYDIGNTFDCDFIAKYISYNSTPKYIYTVMEHEQGSMTVYKKDIILPFQEKISILKKLLVGLHNCHENGIIHLDMKFENVLMRSRKRKSMFVDEPLITDFGFSVRVRNVKAGTYIGYGFGTYGYLAPEHYSFHYKEEDRREKYIYRGSADIWAFGVIAYRLILGKRLYPLNISTDEEIYNMMVEKFKNGDIVSLLESADSDSFNDLSREDRDDVVELLSRTLSWNYKERYNTRQLLNLPIFVKSVKVDFECPLNTQRRFAIRPNSAAIPVATGLIDGIASLIPTAPVIVYYHAVDMIYRIFSISPFSSYTKEKDIVPVIISCMVISCDYNNYKRIDIFEQYLKEHNIKESEIIRLIITIANKLSYTIARPYLLESATSVSDIEEHISTIIKQPREYVKERDIFYPNTDNELTPDDLRISKLRIGDVIR